MLLLDLHFLERFNFLEKNNWILIWKFNVPEVQENVEL